MRHFILSVFFFIIFGTPGFSCHEDLEKYVLNAPKYKGLISEQIQYLQEKLKSRNLEFKHAISVDEQAFEKVLSLLKPQEIKGVCLTFMGKSAHEKMRSYSRKTQFMKKYWAYKRVLLSQFENFGEKYKEKKKESIWVKPRAETLLTGRGFQSLEGMDKCFKRNEEVEKKAKELIELRKIWDTLGEESAKSLGLLKLVEADYEALSNKAQVGVLNLHTAQYYIMEQGYGELLRQATILAGLQALRHYKELSCFIRGLKPPYYSGFEMKHAKINSWEPDIWRISESSVFLKPEAEKRFKIPVTVNGADLSFIVDTGAENVCLTQEQAKAAGFNPTTLNYGVTLSTATNEETNSASWVIIRSIKVGMFMVTNLRCLVLKTGSNGLLGMDFLEKFNIEFNNGLTISHKRRRET